MFSAHTIIAIVQTVVYALAFPVSLYILVRNWPNRPRQAWFPLTAFSLRKNFALLRTPIPPECD